MAAGAADAGGAAGVARSFDVLTHLSATTLPELADAVGDRVRLVRLAGAVDTLRFRPDLDGSSVRRRLGSGRGRWC